MVMQMKEYAIIVLITVIMSTRTKISKECFRHLVKCKTLLSKSKVPDTC